MKVLKISQLIAFTIAVFSLTGAFLYPLRWNGNSDIVEIILICAFIISTCITFMLEEILTEFYSEAMMRKSEKRFNIALYIGIMAFIFFVLSILGHIEGTVS